MISSGRIAEEALGSRRKGRSCRGDHEAVREEDCHVRTEGRNSEWI